MLLVLSFNKLDSYYKHNKIYIYLWHILEQVFTKLPQLYCPWPVKVVYGQTLFKHVPHKSEKNNNLLAGYIKIKNKRKNSSKWINVTESSDCEWRIV